MVAGSWLKVTKTFVNELRPAPERKGKRRKQRNYKKNLTHFKKEYQEKVRIKSEKHNRGKIFFFSTRYLISLYSQDECLNKICIRRRITQYTLK
jgi:hypothetical protein